MEKDEFNENSENDKKALRTFFDVLGTDETGLTRSLASIISKFPTLLNSFLQKDKKIPKSEFSKMRVYAEYSDENSRYDVFCESENCVAIIEAKIGLNIVEEEQTEKYLRNLRDGYSQKQKILFRLTEFENQYLSEKNSKLAKDCGVEIEDITWNKVATDIKNPKSKEEFTVNIAEEFNRFSKERLIMETYNIQIWTVSVKEENFF